MDTALKNALADLRKSGAQRLPAVSAIEKAKSGSRWSGVKSNGDRWMFVKNEPESYDCEF